MVGDLYDFFYDWAGTLSVRDFSTSKAKSSTTQMTVNSYGKQICDYWNEFLKNYTKFEFFNSKKNEVKDALIKTALDKFPNKPDITKLSDEEYKKELEALYGEWSAHIDNGKFKKPLGDA